MMMLLGKCHKATVFAWVLGKFPSVPKDIQAILWNKAMWYFRHQVAAFVKTAFVDLRHANF
jgi:hypothetical protein